ncbi:MAG: AraC family transcriptional regulator [Planctomycetota bacterium]
MDGRVICLHNMVNPLHNLHFLHGKHIPRCVASVDKHFGYYTLQMMTSGGVDLWIDRDAYQLRGAWLWPTWPQPTRIRFHEAPRRQPLNHRYIAFDGPRVAAWEAEGLWPQRPCPIPDVAVSRHLTNIFDEILRYSPRVDPIGRRRAVNLLDRLLIELAELSQPAPAQWPEWLSAVLAALQDWNQEPDYAQLAEDAGMSLSTLRRCFRRATGQAPHTFRLNARISAARTMLGETHQPIKRIASTLGYCDVYYFTRQFKQAVGLAPAQYRATRQL